jgi:DNA-binding XRE family transcriptional regulator
MSDPREPVRLLEETPDTVTLRRPDWEAVLNRLEDAEDSIAVLEHRLVKATGGAAPEMLTSEEATRLIDGENPLKFWREKRGLTVRSLANLAEVSPSLVTEIEGGTKTGSVDTLRKLAHQLKVDLDTLVP